MPRLLWLLLAAALPLAAAEREALVIGNAAYLGQPPLANPLNDARDMAKTLRGLGFTLYGGAPLENAGRDTMARAINRFLARVQGQEGVAIVYYAGHGLRDAAGESYLVPTDARIEQESDIRTTSYPLSALLDPLNNRPAAPGTASLVILDACRNNPFSLGVRGALGGLGAPGEPPRGTWVLYAATPGQTADDNRRGQNGLFTARLLPRLTTPGLDIKDAFDAVSLEVERETHGRQVPWSSGNLRGRFYLAGEPAPAVSVPPPAPPPAAPPRPETPRVATVPVPDMVRINGGCFEMGSPEGEQGRYDNERQHRVCVEGFTLGRYEVTVGEFRRFVTATGYQTDAERDAGGLDGCWAFDADDKKTPWAWRDWADWRTPNRAQPNQEDHPVVCVSWNDAVAYTEWLNRELGGGWRLPTEAEWEYAARAGTTTARFWGDGEEGACRYGNVANAKFWTPGFACEDGYQWVSPVGRFEPNPWGLKDMLGNVWEWTCSEYDEKYGGAEKRCEGKNHAKSAPLRGVRGGSWGGHPRLVRAANRLRLQPEDRSGRSGFRLARTLSP